MNNLFSSYLKRISILVLLIPLAPFMLLSGVENTGMEKKTVDEEKQTLDVLFLGDSGHHRPDLRIQQLIPYLASQGITIEYTDQQDDLTAEVLKKYDVFMMYGNRTGLTPLQEKALLGFVNSGGGFVAVHSTSASFNDSDAFVSLVGGAFKAHGTGVFKTDRLASNHPVFKNVPNFESWDETYVHIKHNPDKKVLSVRTEGDHEEPWTWVRNQGDGRVFYTAWGHDERTWGKPGFQKLLEQGIRWTAGNWALNADFSPPELTYGEGKLPYYPAGEPWGTTGEPITEIQNSFTPEKSAEHVLSTPDFKVELFASEPDIINVIDMTWDKQGRLWVLETIDYPNDFKEDREGNDRIKILEDTNNDGKADKFTVFADGLNIATSLVLANGGAIVSQAPDMLFLKDTNGDDKADEKQVLFTGWGTFDTHAGPNNLHYGFDNQIWGAVGYSAFEGTVDGHEMQFSSGFYRFQPDGSSLEHISHTTNNTWGLGFSEEGYVFGSTANNDVPVYSAVPNRYYDYLPKAIKEMKPDVDEQQRRRASSIPPRLPRIAVDNHIYPITKHVRQVDQHGRYTAGSGMQLYTARSFPESYWNRKAFIGEPTAHLLGEFTLDSDGSGYQADNNWNMLASQDEWFSPVQTKVGPDGALWVSDWYNLVIQHNPFPDGWERGEGNAYVTQLRDSEHGRIYRITHKEGNHDVEYNLANASPEELVNGLTHSNLFWRLKAQQLLVERGNTDVLALLYDLIQSEKLDEVGLDPGALHAIWTLDGLQVLDGTNSQALNVVYDALYHPVSAVRRAALMVMPKNKRSLEQVLAADLIPNPASQGEMDYTVPSQTMEAADPKVRLAALLTLTDMPADKRVGVGAAEMIVNENNANDRWIRDAILIAASKNRKSFLDRVLQKQVSSQADSTMKANISSTVEKVAHFHATEQDRSEDVVTLLLSLKEADPVVGNAFVKGIASGWPENAQPPTLTAKQRKDLVDLGKSLSADYKESLDLLATKWDSAQIFGSLE